MMNNYYFYFFVLNISCSSYIVNVKIQNFQSQYFVTNESWKKGKFYTDYTRLLADRWFLVSWRYSLLKTGADNYTRSIHASRERPDETLRCYAHLTWGALKVSFDWHHKSAIATGVFSAATLTITEPIAVTCYKITSVKSYEEICAA